MLHKLKLDISAQNRHPPADLDLTGPGRSDIEKSPKNVNSKYHILFACKRTELRRNVTSALKEKMNDEESRPHLVAARRHRKGIAMKGGGSPHCIKKENFDATKGVPSLC